MISFFKARGLQCFIAVIASSFSYQAIANRILDESTVIIKGELRRYYRLHDLEMSKTPGDSPAIVLLNGSGCDDFGSNFRGFFKKYSAPLDVYFLDKPHIKKNADGSQCSKAYEKADQLNRRVSDSLEFMAVEPMLRKRADRSIAILGFSEGGVIAPIVASKSKKVGWLVTTGGGGGLTQGHGFLVFADRGVRPYAKPFSRDIFLKEYALIQADPNSLKKKFFGHSYYYWSSHLFYDPIATYAKLDIPIVAAMGEKDESVPIESGQALQKYFSKRGEGNFRFITFPNADHGFQAGQKNYMTTFIASLAKWFKGDPEAFNNF